MDPSSGNFHTQLKQMNLVYKNSFLTIVAAAGFDSSYGLPGVSRRRVGSPHVRVGGRTMTSISQTGRDELEKSIWATRGWTYQEGLLSVRRLIFTEKQVYYECQTRGRCEGVMMTPKVCSNTWITRDPQLEVFGRIFAPNRIGSRGIDINRRIEEYSKRVLTNQNDILNALLGLFELFREQFAVQHLWGIPYPDQDQGSPSPNSPVRMQRNCFLRSLVWETPTCSTRRSAFPSWSWAGWHHAIKMRDCCWDNHGGVWSWYTIVDKNFSIQVERKDGTLIDWAFCEEIQQPSFTSTTRTSCLSLLNDQEVSRFLHIDTYGSRILHVKNTRSPGFATLELASSDKRCWCGIKLQMDLKDCSTKTHDLYVLHMPWKNSEWMIVVQNLGDYWERVGLAALDKYQYGIDESEIKKTRMKIRLG
jgi:hypothetical protein